MASHTFVTKLGAAVFSLVFSASTFAQGGYDQFPKFFESRSVLPSYVPLVGKNYVISPHTRNNGALNVYELTVDGKRFTVEGTDLLLHRLRELKALEAMEAVSSSDTFRDSVGNAALAPLDGAYGLITEPVETIGGAISGIGSFFSNLGHAAVGASSDEEVGIVKTAVGYGATRRGVAAGFAIDPYTSFEPVKDRLADLTWASTSGSLGVSALLAQVPGSTGEAVGLLKSTHGFSQLVYDNSPAELKDINQERLEQMGVTAELIAEFLNHPNYTPSMTTSVIDFLASIGARNRSAFIARAILVDSEEAAFFMMRWAEAYSRYNENVNPLVEFVSLGSAPVAKRADNVLIAVLPIDHLAWTPEFEATHMQNMKALRNLSGVAGGQIWTLGTLSALARANLNAQNWVIVDFQGSPLEMR